MAPTRPERARTPTAPPALSRPRGRRRRLVRALRRARDTPPGRRDVGAAGHLVRQQVDRRPAVRGRRGEPFLRLVRGRPVARATRRPGIPGARTACRRTSLPSACAASSASPARSSRGASSRSTTWHANSATISPVRLADTATWPIGFASSRRRSSAERIARRPGGEPDWIQSDVAGVGETGGRASIGELVARTGLEPPPRRDPVSRGGRTDARRKRRASCGSNARRPTWERYRSPSSPARAATPTRAT